MRSVNLQIKDDYFEKIISFLEMLPKDVIEIKEEVDLSLAEKNKIIDAAVNSDISNLTVEDIKHRVLSKNKIANG